MQRALGKLFASCQEKTALQKVCKKFTNTTSCKKKSNMTKHSKPKQPSKESFSALLFPPPNLPEQRPCLLILQFNKKQSKTSNLVSIPSSSPTSNSYSASQFVLVFPCEVIADLRGPHSVFEARDVQRWFCHCLLFLGGLPSER